jgi:hypothetical protein
MGCPERLKIFSCDQTVFETGMTKNDINKMRDRIFMKRKVREADL